MSPWMRALRSVSTMSLLLLSRGPAAAPDRLSLVAPAQLRDRLGHLGRERGEGAARGERGHVDARALLEQLHVAGRVLDRGAQDEGAVVLEDVRVGRVAQARR